MNNVGQINKTATWALSMEVMRAIAPYYQIAMRAVIKHTGIGNNWYALHLVRGTEPEPFTLSRYQQLSPYTAKDLLQDKLDQLTEDDFLIKDPLGNYHLTKTGRKAIERTIQMAHREMGKVRALPYQQMQYVADLLHKVVYSSLRLPLPIERHAIKISRWTDVGEYAPTTTRIEQYLTDLKRFHEDAYIASWQRLSISGEAWEAFTMIWRGEANSAKQLSEILKQRGHSQKSYTKALHSLVQRGWIEEGEHFGNYRMTELGCTVHEDVAHMTDHIFFAGWDCLTDDEHHDLHLLLSELQLTLQKAAA